MHLELYERATMEGFFREGYLFANPDVRKAGVEPKVHFRMHGAQEGRLQVNPQIMRNDSAYRKTKFQRFRNILLLDGSMRQPTSFPCYIGADHLDLSAYLFESANSGFGPFISEIEANPLKGYLDLGCGLRPRVYENCLYLEVYPSLTADLIVEPTCFYPIASDSLDGIGCFAVLEHTLKPWVVVEEIHRMLKPGGRAFIDWPFLQPVHGFPSHYFNATREGLESLFREKFEIDICTTYPNQTPDHTVSWVLGKMVRELPDTALRNRILSMSVGELLESNPGGDLWNQIISALPDRMISEFACGNSLVAQKKH